MKLRIMGNSLRLRLSQSEVEELGKRGKIINSTRFPADKSLTCELMGSDIDDIECTLNNNTISIRVPQPIINEWVTTEMVGIDQGIHLDNQSRIKKKPE